MALNKIVYKDRTLMDLTNTTATEADVFTGKIFYKADGSVTVGTNGGSLGLCLNHESGEYILPDSAYQLNAGPIGFIVNRDSSGGQDDDPSSLNLQDKIVTYSPTESEQSHNVTADSQYDGLNKVTVNIGKIASNYVGSGINKNNQTNLIVDGATVTTSAGYYQNNVSKTIASGTAGTPTAIKGTVSNHSVTITPSVTNTTGYIIGSTKTGIDITVSASELVSGSKSIVNNGTNIDVTNYATVNVNVPSDGSAPLLQSKSVTPSESIQNITADTGYDGLSSVEVEAIDSTYVGSEIDRRDDANLTVSGATVTAPAGYYASAVSKSVTSGSAGTPTVTKGTVSNNSISITPSVTNTTGYITGGTKTGTAISVTASELVSGTLTINSSGTKNVTNYASASVANGTVTAPTSISGTSASINTGTNTLTLNKTISVTPNVTTAGYISNGTASNAAVSLTANITTKATATINTSTTDQTIASGTYLTGTQTIKAVTYSGLSPSNIANGVTVKIGDANDDDRIANITGTLAFSTIYTGSSAPSSSQGVNGDIYIQS